MSARDAIEEAGFGLFLAHGYDGAGLAAILNRAGVSKGAFYHHFASKQALFEAVMVRYFPSPFPNFDWEAHLALDAAGQKRAIAGLYNELFAASAEMGADLIRYFALFFDALSRLPAYLATIEAIYGRLTDGLAAALVRDEGLSDVEAEAEARAAVARFEGEFYLWAVSGKAPRATGRTERNN